MSSNTAATLVSNSQCRPLGRCPRLLLPMVDSPVITPWSVAGSGEAAPGRLVIAVQVDHDETKRLAASRQVFGAVGDLDGDAQALEVETGAAILAVDRGHQAAVLCHERGQLAARGTDLQDRVTAEISRASIHEGDVGRVHGPSFPPPLPEVSEPGHAFHAARLVRPPEDLVRCCEALEVGVGTLEGPTEVIAPRLGASPASSMV